MVGEIVRRRGDSLGPGVFAENFRTRHQEASDRFWPLLVLGMLAGLYIGRGGQVSLVALTALHFSSGAALCPTASFDFSQLEPLGHKVVRGHVLTCCKWI